MQKILPPMTPLSQPFFDGCKNGELRVQRCISCGEKQFYPRIACSSCAGRDLDWVTVSGRGTVASFSIVERGISSAYEAPYVVALVDLQEGPRMMSELVDMSLQDVRVGAAVQVVFRAWSEEVTMPVFQLAVEGESV